jgi:signal transduction histidine kinase
MNKKLLYKTTVTYLIFSVFLLIVSAPAIYFLMDRLYIEETDESLELQKKEFVEVYANKMAVKDIPLWNKYNRNVQILDKSGPLKDSLFDKTYYDQLESEYEPYREINSPVTIDGKKYTYSGRINLIEREDMVKSIVIIFLLMIVMLLGGILLITKISSKKLWRPFYDTLEQVQGFEINKNKTPKFIGTDIAEFSQLNKSLEKLVVKNIEIYNNQKEFVENAAHELQTPLALFQAKIDTLYQLDNSKEHSVILNSLNNDVARLTRLNKNLLLLSKIDNEGYPKKQTIVLNDFIKKPLDFFTEQAKSRNLTIETDFDETAQVSSNPELAEVLINNLFLNSIRHNMPNGLIIINISKGSLTFSNSGVEKPLVIEKLFNRFTKSDPSSPGNGLGLAIIKKIAQINDWKISYSFSNNLHNFSVTF